MDLGLLDLLGLAGFQPQRDDRIVRHRHRKYPVQTLVEEGLLEAYQAYQSKPVFHKASHVISTVGIRGTQARFVGVYRVNGWTKPDDSPRLTESEWESEWRRGNNYCYQLERVPGLEHLEDRVIVQWGAGALAWCQRVSNKPVLEVTAPGRELPPFDDYLEFSLSFGQLRALFKNDDAHHEWRSRLSAVAGIYLITAETSGDLYVGSATGASGIWGRWHDYFRTGHGGNEQLKNLLATDKRYPSAFRFSLLQILPKSTTRNDVVSSEEAFKRKLGCRAHGLN